MRLLHKLLLLGLAGCQVASFITRPIPATSPSELKLNYPLFLRATPDDEGAETAKETPADAKPSKQQNPVDDVFNSIPFIIKRKEAMEKEMLSIDQNLEDLKAQESLMQEEWGEKVDRMRRDFNMLRSRYHNDTQEVALSGRSNVFVDIMSVVEDFERAKMAYKPASDEEREVINAYDSVKEAIIGSMTSSGLESIQTVGQPFDFKLHDCMFTEQSTEYAEDIVTREFSKGFSIAGKVIRPAKVACSTGPGPS